MLLVVGPSKTFWNNCGPRLIFQGLKANLVLMPLRLADASQNVWKSGQHLIQFYRSEGGIRHRCSRLNLLYAIHAVPPADLVARLCGTPHPNPET